jgi:hypothetical protein
MIATPPSHLRRLAGEQITQVFSIAVGFLDRILLTAVLIRLWGHSQFETWSVCLSIAGLVSLFELGFNLYFNNRMMAECERGAFEQARHTYHLANTIFVFSAAIGLLAIAVVVGLSGSAYLTGGIDGKIIVMVIASVTALRLALCGVNALYRAHRQFARLSIILTTGEALRIGVALIAAGFGGGLVAVAACSTIAATLVQVVYIIVDAERRFQPMHFGIALPRSGEMRQAILKSAAFFAQNVPLILLLSVPVLVLRAQVEEAGSLAAFVLLRTMSGLPRMLLQSFGVVFGLECGRRISIADRNGSLTVLSEAARLIAVLSGLMSGIMIAGGREIIQLWTGSPDLFRFDQLAAATIPMIVAAVSILAHNLLVASNAAPHMAAWGRWLQLALTAVFVVIAPIPDPALRMMSALAFGEILGFAPIAYRAVSNMVPGAGLAFHLLMLAWTCIGLVIGAMATSTLLALLSGAGLVGVCAAFGLALFTCSFVAFRLGLAAPIRKALYSDALYPMLAWMRRGGKAVTPQ